MERLEEDGLARNFLLLLHLDLVGGSSCKVWIKAFNRKYNRDVHVSSHEANNKKKFPCESCDARFVTKGQMKSHYLRIHTDEMPFECPHCKKKFNVMANCNSHVKNACPIRFQKKSKIKRTNKKGENIFYP